MEKVRIGSRRRGRLKTERNLLTELELSNRVAYSSCLVLTHSVIHGVDLAFSPDQSVP